MSNIDLQSRLEEILAEGRVSANWQPTPPKVYENEFYQKFLDKAHLHRFKFDWKRVPTKHTILHSPDNQIGKTLLTRYWHQQLKNRASKFIDNRDEYIRSGKTFTEYYAELGRYTSAFYTEAKFADHFFRYDTDNSDVLFNSTFKPKYFILDDCFRGKNWSVKDAELVKKALRGFNDLWDWILSRQDEMIFISSFNNDPSEIIKDKEIYSRVLRIFTPENIIKL